MYSAAYNGRYQHAARPATIELLVDGPWTFCPPQPIVLNRNRNGPSAPPSMPRPSPAAAPMPLRSMMTRASKLSPAARCALRATSPGHGAARQGRRSCLRTGAMTQAKTPPLAVALDAAVLDGDPAKPLPSTQELVACCCRAPARSALPTSTCARRQHGHPAWRYAVTGRWPWGGLACRRMALAYLGRSGAQRHTAWCAAGGSMAPRPLTSL